jgi:Uma2 family endonuclease
MTAVLPSTIDTLVGLLSVEQYHHMIRAGVFKNGDKIELLEGVLVPKMTKHWPHTFATQVLRSRFERLLPEASWFVNDQEPVTTTDSEPEPDLLIVRGSRLEYARQQRHPEPEETGLLIEVADSSLEVDRGAKKRIYARAGIVEYWIVNIPVRCVEVYNDPTGPCEKPTFGSVRTYDITQQVPVVLDGTEVGRIAVAELFI